MRTTSDRRHYTERLTVTADPRVVDCVRSDHRQSIHTLHTMLTLSRVEVLDFVRTTDHERPATARPSSLPNQYVLTAQAYP
jgi:hypothetical protein